MKSVFLLWHTHRDENLPGGENSKLIGVYSNKIEAESAKSRSEKLPGFRDHLEDFEIVEYELDIDHWKEGFATI